MGKTCRNSTLPLWSRSRWMKTLMRPRRQKALILKLLSSSWNCTFKRWKVKLAGKCWLTLAMISIFRLGAKSGTTNQSVNRSWELQEVLRSPRTAFSIWKSFLICIKQKIHQIKVCSTNKASKRSLRHVHRAMVFCLIRKRRPNLTKVSLLSSGSAFGKKLFAKNQRGHSNSWYTQDILVAKWAMRFSRYL